jgi:HEAT repeat protein
MGIDNKTRELLTNLKSSEPEFVLRTIEQVRESGNPLVLNDLIDLLRNTRIESIKKSILNLLSELKDETSIPVLISAIRDEKYIGERKELIACCWQNGLIYNAYLSDFIDIIINEEFPAAFEAFTVIENMFGTIADEIIEVEIIKVTNALKNSDEEKTYLLNGLLTIIRDIPEKQEFAD